MNNPFLPLQFPRSFPAVLLLLCLLLLLAACGRRPTAPTPLPPGTRVVQPTPDFSAPAQADTATQTSDQVAASLRTRLARQQAALTATPVPTGDASPDPAQSVLSDHPELAVFSRPTALGILSGGGLLYSAPGGGALVTLQVGATLTITGRSADRAWFAVYLADGVAGWVPAAQVRVFGDANQLEIVQESLGPAVVATLIAEASKPQEPLSAVTVRLTATTTAAAASPQSTPEPPSPPEITGPAVTVIVEGANVRSGPGTDFPVVAGLYQDESAALLGRNQSGDWLQIELPDGPAWIFAPLVQTTVPIADLPLIDPPPTPEP